MLSAIITPLLLLIAFVLLLLVSISVPIIKSIFLFRLAAHASSRIANSSAQTSVQFGVWGYCISAMQVSVAGFDRSQPGKCSPRHLGYSLDSTVADALNVDALTHVISRASTGALVLHPIAAALSFLTFLISLLMIRHGARGGTSRLFSLATLVVGSFAAGVATIAFLIDVIVIAIARHRVADATDDLVTLNWGNAVWITLGATVALYLALVTSCAGVCCGGSRKRARY